MVLDNLCLGDILSEGKYTEKIHEIELPGEGVSLIEKVALNYASRV